MDLRFSDDEEAFREEVRNFVRQELATDWRGTVGWEQESEEFAKQFRRKMGEKGWLALSWPKEVGGLCHPHIYELILVEEIAYHRAPARTWKPGAGIIGPTILLHGSEDQKRQHLPLIVEGKVSWCQAFTEPNSGSDVASIQTRAVEDGDDFVVNGQKTFASGADWADWCSLLVRTSVDVPKYQGLSYLLVDMKSPGITVRPLINMLGTHHFNDVFFDDVRVPKKNLLGEKDQGWYIALTTLDFERYTLGAAAGESRRLLEDLIACCKETKYNGQALAQDSIIRRKLADRAIEIEVLQLLNYRLAWMADQGIIPKYEACMGKLYATELAQRLANTGMEILGLHSQLKQESKWAPQAGVIASLCLSSPSETIQGGTSEIQRNIIATRGLGLPRG